MIPLLWAVLITQAVIYALFEWNLASYKPFDARPLPGYPPVSVLVPGRNEERGIGACLKSLLAQDYPDFEVVVYDDESTDATPRILAELEAQSAACPEPSRRGRLRVLRGAGLPEGWTGKNNACARLADAARGDWILFTDADTEHAPDMLKKAVQTAVHRQAAFVSTFPRQRFSSWGDELLVPLMFFVLLCFLPMYFVQKRTWKWAGNFSAGCGQFLLFRRDAYDAAGGHAGLKNRISEGLVLAERVKSRGNRIVLADGSSVVSCSMYRGFGEAFRGFSRSVFASMGGSVLSAVFFVAVQTFAFLLPYATLAAALAAGPFDSAQGWRPAAAALSLLGVALPLWIRWRIHRRTGMSGGLVPFHALGILAYNAIILNSFYQFRIGKKTSWKDRSYAEPQS